MNKRHVMDILEEKFSTLSGGRVLDVATGGGAFIQFMQKNLADYTEIIGIDISDNYFEAARKTITGGHISFVVMDASRIQYPDHSFDTVTIANSLHHLADIPVVLTEMKRVLRPGGRIVIREVYCDNQSETQLSHVYMHHWWAKINRLDGIIHNSTMTRQEIIDLAERLDLAEFESFDYVHPAPDEKEVSGFIDLRTDEYIAKLDGKPEQEELKREGERLRRRVYEVGLTWATELFIIGKK